MILYLITYKKVIPVVVGLFVLGLLSFFIYKIFSIDVLLLLIAVCAIILLVAFITVQLLKKQKYTEQSNISRLVLFSGNGATEKEWLLEGRNSFLIGKSSYTADVDIELIDTGYADYISDEHAVLNFAYGFWYIEDLGSINGVGLKRKGEVFALRIKPFEPYKIEHGDIIYISKLKFLVQ